MGAIVICGTQWGDEGKGMVVDLYGERADMIVRYQGGNNAGHTVIANGKKTILHHIPSGILHDDVVCVIGNGVVVFPEILLQEIDRLKERGDFQDDSRLKISDRAQVIMPYHTALDGAGEAFKGKGKIGTTGRGIGPTYRDKVGRSGIRFGDLCDEKRFRQSLEESLPLANFILEKFYDAKPLEMEAIFDEYCGYANRIRQYVTQTPYLINQFVSDGKKVLFEGAQGTMLDIDHGTYPFVTSSNTTIGAVCTGSGVGPKVIDSIYGVVKAYTTRVGAGPFPTELEDEVGQKLRDVGGEYGSTTGRPRRCGWLDLVVLKYATMLNSLTGYVLTKLDVLDGIETIRVCTHYELDGQKVDTFPADLQTLGRCKPVYVDLPGWEGSVKDARSMSDLPKNARDYIDFISKELGIDPAVVSVGPARDETIVIHNPFA